MKYFNPDEIGQLGLRPDAKVRIVDGIFEGKEGYYQRIKGSRSKCFVVKIDNFLACAAVLTESKSRATHRDWMQTCLNGLMIISGIKSRKNR